MNESEVANSSTPSQPSESHRIGYTDQDGTPAQYRFHGSMEAAEKAAAEMGMHAQVLKEPTAEEQAKAQKEFDDQNRELQANQDKERRIDVALRTAQGLLFPSTLMYNNNMELVDGAINALGVATLLGGGNPLIGGGALLAERALFAGIRVIDDRKEIIAGVKNFIAKHRQQQ
ncbi:MAG: hypothetical protein ABIO02_00620 [Patescibacteria group bacterium]